MDFPRKEPPILDTSEELCFQIIDWYMPENDKYREKPEEPDLYSMNVYGTTQEGFTVCVNVKDYEPYFYVKPPAKWENLSDKQFMNEVYSLRATIEDGKYECIFKKNGKETKYQKKIIPNGYSDHLKDITVEKKKDFWGFTNGTDFRFIKVCVKSQTLFNNLKYYFISLKKSGFKLYESNIDPFLRYIHSQNIKPCGWVKVVNYEINDTDMNTRCDYNIETNYKNLISIDVNSIAPLIIASFDIECMSSHGDFPVAKKDYRKVAQDLSNVAKAGYDITEEFILYWLETIYTDDAIIDDNLKINKVYPKKPVVFEKYEEGIKESSSSIIEILEKIADISCDSGDEDEEQQKTKTLTLKEQNILESKLNDILTKKLPPLKGDKIIQIGTTVHRYGSDEIIYKNIITLDTCDPIPDTDVITCKTEKQVLMEWKKLIMSLNPDILTGYNIFGFDMEYMYNRALENNIIDEFISGLGRNLTRKSNLVKQELSSSALGENILKYFDMDGTVVIDLFKVMQREHKLDSYKLDNVASIFIGDKKDDLKPHEIFEKFKGNSQDRCVIAKYCIQDCALVNKLLHKLKILENNIGMGNVCLVPLNYLFRRGQGIKIFSLIAKQCMDRNHLIPVINAYDTDKEYDKDGYEGAVVLEPKEGIYLNDPIVVFDYGSLYPSSMIARNLSHDCYVMDEKYKVNDPNIDYMTVSYDLYEGTGDKKRKVGVKECIFAQYKDGRKGIIADILCLLLDQRKNTRKKMEYKTVITKNNEKHSGILKETENDYEIMNIETNEKILVSKNDVKELVETYNNFEKDVFDALQLAYKITANSLYGQIGARTSPIYLKDIAACTTATGREMIMLAKDFVETNYNAEVIYGDSVMPYTPITYRTDNKITVSTFESLEGSWFPYKNFKVNDKDRYEKEQFMPTNIYVWTHKGWSKVKRFIRHKTIKKIYRVVTGNGVVDVTEDHSLLDQNVDIIKPKECKIGTMLLHSQPKMNNYYTKIDEKQAYVYGQFVGNGRCYVYQDIYCKKIRWEIKSNNIEILEKCKKYLNQLEKNITFIITYSNQEYILQPSTDENIDNFIEKYSSICYHKNIKVVPDIILNSSQDIMMKFKKGLDDITGSQYIIDINHQIKAQSFVVLFQMLNNSITINYSKEKINIQLNNNNTDAIQNITKIHNSYDGYVYDIETEEGVFHGGIGNLILKNTDSIFCKFPLKDNNGLDINGKESLKYAIEIGKHVEKNIVSIMPKPQKLNYEKSLFPFIIFSKKRYVGNLYENDDKKFKQKSMGIVLKRRDNAPIVKKIYGGIIDILLNQQDLYESIKYLSEELKSLVDGKTPISELVISKSLRASYKDPSKIPHKVLADRIAERDPGNKPQVNDRIPFVYIKVPDAKLQGDRIENPDYIIENNLKPDYLHYITNQIMNPVIQLYALCLTDLPNYDKSLDYWEEIENELKKKPLYTDDVKRKHRLDNLKLNMVKELLFQEFIDILSEPVVKKERKVSTKIKKNIEVVNEIVHHIDNGNKTIVNASISVIKKKDKNSIVSVAKIMNNKKSMWDYSNDNCSDKTREIIKIIVEMVQFAKTQNIKLNIKINNKEFVKNYNLSLLNYKEFSNAVKKDENLVKQALDTNDIGIIKNVNTILIYEKLFDLNDNFSLIN